MRFRRFLTCLLLVMLGLAAPSLSFAQYPSGLPLPNASGQVKDPDQEKREREIAKKANEQRQAQLKRDTDNLLKLATELKTYVDKSSENTLSVDVVRKAEEIEKLARNIKDKMKGD